MAGFMVYTLAVRSPKLPVIASRGTAKVTVIKVVPLIPAEEAVMVELPTATAVASPVAMSIVAAAVVAEVHVAEPSTCVLPSLKWPVAVNCTVPPAPTLGFAGVTVMVCSVGAVTVSRVLPLTEPEVAVMVELPGATAVASPVPLIVAVAVVPELQVTVPSTCVVPLLKWPVAVNCCVAPFEMLGFVGVTTMD